MARSRFCKVCKDWHNTDQVWPVECYGHFGIRADREGPQIISDTIEPFLSHADGRMYSSKSRYRAELRARGMIEMGNDRQPQKAVELPPVRDTLRQVYQQLRG